MTEVWRSASVFNKDAIQLASCSLSGYSDFSRNAIRAPTMEELATKLMNGSRLYSSKVPDRHFEADAAAALTNRRQIRFI